MYNYASRWNLIFTKPVQWFITIYICSIIYVLYNDIISL